MSKHLVYFDTSVFLDIFRGAKNGPQIRALLDELQGQRVTIYTSIITVQEASVLSYRRGTVATDNHSRVGRMARIQNITKDIALTAAKLEANCLDLITKPSDELKAAENKRRKWDCFHIATALALECDVLYTTDTKMRSRQKSLKITALKFLEPKPDEQTLDFQNEDVANEDKAGSSKAEPESPAVQRSGNGSPGDATASERVKPNGKQEEGGKKAGSAEEAKSPEVRVESAESKKDDNSDSAKANT